MTRARSCRPAKPDIPSRSRLRPPSETFLYVRVNHRPLDVHCAPKAFGTVLNIPRYLDTRSTCKSMAKDLAGLFLVFIGAGECRLSRLSPEMPDGPASLPVPSPSLDTIPGGSYVLLCGSGLRDTVGMRFCGDVAFRILSVIQVRTTLGWRPLSIYNYCSRTTMSIRRCWVRVHGEAG